MTRFMYHARTAVAVGFLFVVIVGAFGAPERVQWCAGAEGRRDMTMREDDIDELVERLASPYHLTRPERDRVIATLKRLSTLTDEMVERGARGLCFRESCKRGPVRCLCDVRCRAETVAVEFTEAARACLTEAIRAAKGE